MNADKVLSLLKETTDKSMLAGLPLVGAYIIDYDYDYALVLVLKALDYDDVVELFITTERNQELPLGEFVGIEDLLLSGDYTKKIEAWGWRVLASYQAPSQ